MLKLSIIVDLEKNQQLYKEIFCAWLRDILDKNIALGQTIDENVREAVRPLYDRLNVGLKEDWKFSNNLTSCLNL